MSKIIIGIHGLSNKPAADTLQDWWKEAIKEGLKKNTGISSPEFDFESVYWADVMYDQPDTNPDSYKPAKEGEIRTYEASKIDILRAIMLDNVGSIFDKIKKHISTINRLAEEVLDSKLKDLHRYYEEQTVRETLRERLKRKILEHQGKRIMILSHSMGTIIAYDVLRSLGREHARLLVDHFVTLGSPLGLPHVKLNIAQENPSLRTPSIVRKWSNFADRRDPVSLDVYLSGDYEANDDGVKVKDDLVANDWGGVYHKSYGYLRTPEVSKIIRQFI